MRTPSPDLSIPLSEAELDELTEILLARFDEDSEPVDGDEGVLDVSELDGLLTAVVSSPVTILPSQWLPVLWGDFPPVFETEAEVERVFSLMLRQMNDIALTLMNCPEEFVPLFYYRKGEDREYMVVDE